MLHSLCLWLVPSRCYSLFYSCESEQNTIGASLLVQKFTHLPGWSWFDHKTNWHKGKTQTAPLSKQRQEHHYPGLQKWPGLSTRGISFSWLQGLCTAAILASQRTFSRFYKVNITPPTGMWTAIISKHLTVSPRGICFSWHVLQVSVLLLKCLSGKRKNTIATFVLVGL